MARRTRPAFRSLRALGVTLALAAFPWNAETCPFCAKMTRTLTDEMRDARAVVVGSLVRVDVGSARLTVDQVIREPEDAMPSLVRVALAPGAGAGSKLIFLDKENTGWKVARTDQATGALGPYLDGAWRRRSLPPADRLPYFFQHLDSAEGKIAQDAYGEFAKASYRATRQAASSYDPARLRTWIDNAQGSPDRIGLYGLLLGLSGQPSDAEFLKQRIDHPSGDQIHGLDGLLGGLYLLDSQAGIDRMVSCLTRPDARSLERSSGLAALRFVLADAPPKDPAALLRQTEPALAHPESAGPLIDEFRKARLWQAAPLILPMFEKLRDPSSVVRFALASPDEASQKWVADLERSAPQLVLDAKQTLQFEASARDLDLSTPTDR